MQTTGNLGLKKPEGTDIVDIADLNGNMDILDNAVTGKVDKVTGKQLSTNDYTTVEKTKLAGVATGATNYTHPATHPPAIIAQDASNRFVTDAEKTAWNAKAGTAVATTAMNGLMSAADKTLLNNNTGFGTTAGTATAYTVTLSPTPTALIAGLKFSFKTHIAGGANPTLNPNTLGAKAIKKPNGNGATLALNGVYTVVYDGTAFILQGEGGEYGTAVAADVIAGKTIGTEGGLIDGAIVQRGAMDGYTNSVSAAWASGGGCWVRIPAGAYLKTTAVGNPEIRVTDPNVVPANWLRGVSMFGQDGTIVNRSVENNHSPSNSAEAWVTGEVFLMPQAGYYNGSTWVKTAFPTLIPSNVRAGVPIGTLIGTLQPTQSARGTTYGPGSITITGLSFTPKVFTFSYNEASTTGWTNVTGFWVDDAITIRGNIYGVTVGGSSISVTFTPTAGGITVTNSYNQIVAQEYKWVAWG
ncbi:hypothetical protein [Paenibacillus sp. FSL R10-2734]|uniref:hypothetical protein n=1 Tax=Paenibacillus sp. FSL R10-2734 TaxID=2954691 RepID=UPI0030DBADA4